MKRKLSLLLFAFAMILLGATSCAEHWGIEKKPKEATRGVLLYFAGDNNLASYLRENLNEIYRSSAIPSQYCDTILMVFEDISGSIPRLRRYYRTADGDIFGELIAAYDEEFVSGTAEGFARVEQDAFSAYPAKTKGLIISSHGSAWLPTNYYNHPKDVNNSFLLQSFQTNSLESDNISKTDLLKRDIITKSICYDGDHEIEIQDLAKAINQHYEYICFDACFMSSIEVLYELRKSADYILASATEILANGFTYEVIFDNLMAGGEKNLKDCCSELLEYNSSRRRDCTIALIKCSQLESLAACCKTLFSKYANEIGAVMPNRVQRYYRYNDEWFYDFEHYVENFANEDDQAIFSDYLSKVVIAKGNTDWFLSIKISHHCGISTYIPKNKFPILNEFYKTLEWNKVIGAIQ